jgi:hypothetical protein
MDESELLSAHEELAAKVGGSRRRRNDGTWLELFQPCLFNQ